ncbi:hypothetical protein [Rothia sp. (in: high G+C Gram-positive bacteria)]|uniref:hypothetical protein n=1 Tax=Rothia sp. (in: high G+C Gram-positive bacteria) TaxID=1885016 RepID=UPI003217E1AB
MILEAAENISDFKDMGLNVIVLSQQIIPGQGEPGRTESIRWAPALLPNRVD